MNFPIYCINLQHRKDRKEHSLKQFEQLGISPEKVLYPHFTKDDRGGVYGCFDSHMKIWNDFFTKYPDKKYALVFEDDFVITKNAITTLQKAVDFIEKNYEDIDVLFLHNIRVNVDHEINNVTFTRGYGITSHSYFITRHYIQSIISKHGSLPDPPGRHFDFEMNQNIVDKDNWIYTENIFFTNKECIKQISDKSDNYLNIIDQLFRSDINEHNEMMKNTYLTLKQFNILNDKQLRHLSCIINKFVT